MKTNYFNHMLRRAFLALMMSCAAGSTVTANDDSAKIAGAIRISAGNTAGSITSRTEVDWYSFRPLQSGITTISLMAPLGSSAAPGVVFQLKNAVGQPAGALPAGSFTYRDGILQPGALYYIKVMAGSGLLGLGRYRLRLSTPESAIVLANGVKTDHLDNPNDVDLFRFSIPNPGRVILSARPVPVNAPIGLYFDLFDSSGRKIAYQAGSNAQISKFLERAGTYYLRVTPLRNVRNTGWYGVQFSR